MRRKHNGFEQSGQVKTTQNHITALKREPQWIPLTLYIHERHVLGLTWPSLSMARSWWLFPEQYPAARHLFRKVGVNAAGRGGRVLVNATGMDAWIDGQG